MATTNEELIGRSQVDDIEAILAVSNGDSDSKQHSIVTEQEVSFTWDYEQTREPLRFDEINH